MEENLKIKSVEAAPWNVPMSAPYRSAQRITTVAHNVLVRVELEGGSVGFGEAAPATYVTGETQESVLARVQAAAAFLVGANYLTAAEYVGSLRKPGARGALEMAIYDAFARANPQSFMQILTGGPKAPVSQQTDLSLPLLPPNEAKSRSEQAARDGYRTLKIKIGGPNINDDEARVRAVADAAPDAVLRLDGNQGFAPEEAVRFMERLSDLMPRIQLLEQPTKAGDDDALLFVQKNVSVPVFADEAVHNKEDAVRLLELGACKGIVLKLAKSGIRETLEIGVEAKKRNGQILFGCMMETRLGISAALRLAAALAQPAFGENGTPPLLDLDGHLLTNGDGLVSGGFSQTGDVLTFDPNAPGLGVDVVWPPPTR